MGYRGATTLSPNTCVWQGETTLPPAQVVTLHCGSDCFGAVETAPAIDDLAVLLGVLRMTSNVRMPGSSSPIQCTRSETATAKFMAPCVEVGQAGAPSTEFEEYAVPAARILPRHVAVFVADDAAASALQAAVGDQ